MKSNVPSAKELSSEPELSGAIALSAIFVVLMRGAKWNEKVIFLKDMLMSGKSKYGLLYLLHNDHPLWI